MNNINGHGGGGRRSAMASMDFYRRVPKDLTEVSVVACSIAPLYILCLYLMAAEMIGFVTM
jgi:hypothetical protein